MLSFAAASANTIDAIATYRDAENLPPNMPISEAA